MYADKYSRRMKLDPKSMALAIALNGTIVAGLVAFAAPHFVRKIDTIFEGRNIPLPPTPPPIDTPKPKIEKRILETQPTETVTVPHPEVATTTPDTPHFDAGPSLPPNPTVGTATVFEPVKAPPVIVGAQPDARFASAFQPEYPLGERRAQHEGRVTVRVLIGTDGRVKQVERISAASDDFFAATQRRALEKWRFKPATRDGEPFETWRTMSVSFVLKDDE
jgi:protein TonB